MGSRIYVAPEHILYKKQFSTDKVDKSRHAQQRNLSFNFISMQKYCASNSQPLEK